MLVDATSAEDQSAGRAMPVAPRAEIEAMSESAAAGSEGCPKRPSATAAKKGGWAARLQAGRKPPRTAPPGTQAPGQQVCGRSARIRPAKPAIRARDLMIASRMRGLPLLRQVLTGGKTRPV